MKLYKKSYIVSYLERKTYLPSLSMATVQCMIPLLTLIFTLSFILIAIDVGLAWLDCKVVVDVHLILRTW